MALVVTDTADTAETIKTIESKPINQNTLPKLCQLCFLQGQIYTCPTCLLRYCSLSCYKSEIHKDCLEENFYKNEVEQMLKSSELGTEERKGMVEILKRTRDLGLDDEDDYGLNDLSLTQDDDLTEKEIFSPQNQQQFDKLVESGQFGQLIEIWTPWWSSSSLEQPPVSLKPPQITSSPHQDLYYSLVDLVFSYAVAIRTMNGESDDKQELSTIILDLSHILQTTPSKFTYHSVHEVVEMIKYKFISSGMKFEKDSFGLFLSDVLMISSRKEYVLAVLSELITFMNRKVLIKKLEYFMGIVGVMDKSLLEILSVGIRNEGVLLERDDCDGSSVTKSPLIEEI